jgi:hypothetical protein
MQLILSNVLGKCICDHLDRRDPILDSINVLVAVLEGEFAVRFGLAAHGRHLSTGGEIPLVVQVRVKSDARLRAEEEEALALSILVVAEPALGVDLAAASLLPNQHLTAVLEEIILKLRCVALDDLSRHDAALNCLLRGQIVRHELRDHALVHLRYSRHRRLAELIREFEIHIVGSNRRRNRP